MKQLPIPIEPLTGLYEITEDGCIYSMLKNKWLKGSINSSGYKQYYLQGKWYFIHRLVYATFVGPIQYEINHKDMDKTNNHWKNLEDITHGENIKKAREQKPWNSGRKAGFTHSSNTKDKMASAKVKGVKIYDGNTLVHEALSIGLAASWLRTYRKKVYRAIQSSQPVEFSGKLYLLCMAGKYPEELIQCPLEKIPIVDFSKLSHREEKIAKHLWASKDGYRLKFWTKETGMFEKRFPTRDAILEHYGLLDSFPK